jgi:membrane-associated phospholipid phosphatase
MKHVSVDETADGSAVRSRPLRSVFHNIRSPEAFARYPLIGLTMFLVGGSVFGVIAYHLVTGGSLLAWDDRLASRLHATALHSPAWVQNIMIAGYYVGDQLVAVIGVVLAIYFLRKRYWRELTMLTCGFGISALLFLLLADIFDRPRPAFEPEIWGSAQLPGFPSGHAIAVVSSYGLLAYFFVPKLRSRAKKIVMIVVVLLVGVYVNFSRLFLCDHFLTDIIAGTAVGVAWLGLAQTVVELSFRRRAS